MIVPGLAGLLIDCRTSGHCPADTILVAELPLGIDAELPVGVLLDVNGKVPRRPGFLVVSQAPISTEQAVRAIADFCVDRDRRKVAT